MAYTDIHKMIRWDSVQFGIPRLEAAKESLKAELFSMDTDINRLSSIPLSKLNFFDYVKLNNLRSARFDCAESLHVIEAKIIKRRRAEYDDISQFALNHGGVYDYGCDDFRRTIIERGEIIKGISI